MNIKLFFVHCATGCTCCSSENHYRGPYATEEDADRRMKYLENHPVIGSQYARNGRYSVSEKTAELLSGDRMVINDRVFHSASLVEVQWDGSVDCDDRFCDSSDLGFW